MPSPASTTVPTLTAAVSAPNCSICCLEDCCYLFGLTAIGVLRFPVSLPSPERSDCVLLYLSRAGPRPASSSSQRFAAGRACWRRSAGRRSAPRRRRAAPGRRPSRARSACPSAACSRCDSASRSASLSGTAVVALRPRDALLRLDHAARTARRSPRASAVRLLRTSRRARFSGSAGRSPSAALDQAHASAPGRRACSPARVAPPDRP